MLGATNTIIERSTAPDNAVFSCLTENGDQARQPAILCRVLVDTRPLRGKEASRSLWRLVAPGTLFKGNY